MVENKAVFYEELRNNAKQLRAESFENNENIRHLRDASLSIMQLAFIARTEGLLALEEAIERERISELVCGNELSHMIGLIVNGTDPSAIENISMVRYYSQSYTGLEGFLFLFFLDAALSIQSGDHPMIIEDSIKSYMPDEIIPYLDSAKEEREKKSFDESESNWQKLFERDLQIESSHVEYYIIKLVDYCFISLSNEDFQRLLRDIGNDLCALLSKGLSGPALKKIHDNLSKRLAAILYENMANMGPVRIKDVADAAIRVFHIMLKLNEEMEIAIPKDLSKVFEISNACTTSKEECSEIKEWFMGMTNRDIQRVLKDVPHDTLSLAMKSWDTDLRRLIYGNLPRLIAETIKKNTEHYECMDEDIEEANREIEKVIRRLEDSAEIFIRG